MTDDRVNAFSFIAEIGYGHTHKALVYLISSRHGRVMSAVIEAAVITAVDSEPRFDFL